MQFVPFRLVAVALAATVALGAPPRAGGARTLAAGTAGAPAGPPVDGVERPPQFAS